MTRRPINIGDVVVDRDADSDQQNEAVVVNVPPPNADEWETPGGTVATHPVNQQYPADADVVVVVFREELDEARPDYDGSRALSLATLADERVPYFAFPRPRLRRVGELEGALGVSDRRMLRVLADRLEAGGMDVTVDGDQLTASKLGETYRVDADGTVDGDGALATQLRDAVDEVLGEEA